MMARCRLLIVAAAMGMVSSLSWAVTVSPETGTVLVNTGSGFAPITGAVEVPAGAQVMVQPGGMALVTYPNNYSLQLGPGQVWQVQDTPPDTGTVPPASDQATGSITSPITDNTTLLIAGGAILGGGILLAYEFRSASP